MPVISPRRVVSVVLALALVYTAAAQDYEVPLDPESWTPAPGWTPGTVADEHSQSLEDGVASFRARDGGGTMIWVRYYDPPLDFSKTRYVAMRYRVRDIDPTLSSYFLYVDAGTDPKMTGKKIALAADDLIHDGDWHIATTLQQERGELRRVAVRFKALPGREGRVDVAWIRFAEKAFRFPISEYVRWEPSEETDQFLPLTDLMNSELPQLQEALALADWFDSPHVRIAGANFQVNTEGMVAISTRVKEAESFEFPVGVAAAEVHLLIGGQLRQHLLSYRNWETCDRVWRPTQFLVTIDYADGEMDQQIPYCLDKGDYGIWRGPHAYALRTNPEKVIASISVRDGMRMSSAFHLIAATASDRRLAPGAPDLAAPTPPGITPQPVKPHVVREGDRLIAGNTGGKLTFDMARGLAITELGDSYHPDSGLVASALPLFAVKEGTQTWTSEQFAVEEVTDDGATAIVKMRSEQAQTEATVTIEPLDGDEFSLSIRVTNLADDDRRIGVTFPQVALSKAEAPDDLWYFYPRMAVAWSNADRMLKEPHNGQFPVQWMDAYDRAEGGGVYLMTRDLEGHYRWYEMSKAEGTVTQAVEYFDDLLTAGETRSYPPVYLGVHGGDWRIAHRRYCEWVQTWCEPLVPRNEWFREVWNFRTHWTHTMKDGDPQCCWYNKEAGRYQVDEFLDKDSELFGPLDMHHFFDWRISEQYGRWGDYSHYEDIGGLEKFREMVKHQQDHGVRVGLYMDTYLCSKKSEIGQAHGEQWAIHGPNGKFRSAYSKPEDPLWNMCIFSPGWPEYLAERCARVAEETGCDGIYLDEGGMDVGYYWCWREGHGHPVPANSPRGFRDLARKVREALPERVALYTEHCPPDITIPYLDGAYIAALGRSDFEISPGYLHIHRFAFPDFKVLPITSGGSLADGIYDGLKYSLFNGCPLYTLAWGHDEEAFPLIRKINRVLREHTDAFCTLEPEPFVDTLRVEVYCNRFPGEDETVWALWNGRYQTVSGPVLEVKHVEGASYRDLWNDEPLSPTIEGDVATISLTIGPRDIGVVCQHQAR